MPKSLARPSRAELVRAAHKTVPDCIKPGIGVLFAGINPGLYSAYSGRHFAHPGNRFWPALHAGGFTPRVLDPRDEHQLLIRALESRTSWIGQPWGRRSCATRSLWRAGGGSREKSAVTSRARWLSSASWRIAQHSIARMRRWASSEKGSKAPRSGCCPIPAA